MSNVSNTMTMAEFERLLDVYGSDRTRWPIEARAGAGQLVARERAARRLLAEAEALDRALDRAPLPSLAREAALAERIVTAARRSPRMVPAATAAGGDAVRRSAGNVVALPMASERRPRLSRAAVGGVAGAFAASLALGVFLGLSGLSQGMVPALEQATGLSLGGGGRVAAALQVDLLDEDLL
jgi:hypothetical protein